MRQMDRWYVWMGLFHSFVIGLFFTGSWLFLILPMGGFVWVVWRRKNHG